MPTLSFPYYIQNRLPLKTCQVSPGTFLDGLSALSQHYPEIQHYIFQDENYQKLVSSTAFYINGHDIRTLDHDPILNDNDVIEIEPAIVGG